MASQLESALQADIKKHLEKRGWVVFNLHGNRYQKGLPDLWAAHPRYGVRWIEIKRPDRWRLTADQKRVFPKILAANVGIWFVQSVAECDQVLMGPSNAVQFGVKAA